MKMLVLAALLICGIQGMSLSAPGDCPVRGSYTGTTRGVNKLDSQTPRFGINSEIFDTYEPGETYEFELGKGDVSDEVQYFHLLSTALEEVEDCPSLGSWHQPSSTGPQPRDGCDHVLEYSGSGGLGKFQWTAPQCGCVTISGVVVVPGGEYFSDDSSALQGPLTMTLCPQDDDTLTSLYDDEFYGEETQELELIDAVLEEVNDIITDMDDIDEDDEDDITAEEEGEEEEEEEDGNFRRGGRRRGGRGKKGHGKGKGAGRRGHWKGRNEDATSPEGKRGRGRMMGRNDREEGARVRGRGAMFWKRKMGRRARGGEKSEAVKRGRLEKVCAMMEEKEVGGVRSADKSLLTSDALELRAARWATYRDDMLQCCDGEQDDMVGCFREAHGRRISQKVCGAEDEHFQDGEIPQRIEAAQDKCCEIQGGEQTGCLMEAHRVMRKLKRHHKRAKQNNGTRVDAICKRVEKHPLPPNRRLSKLPIVEKNRWTTLFTERRLQVAECCKLAEGEQETCLEDVREQRYDRVCAGEEELSPPWARRDTHDITEQCCVLEGEERYGCFAEQMPARGPHGPHRGHRRGRHGNRDEEEEDAADRRGVKRTSNRRARVWRHKNRRHSRVCCQEGRSAGNALEDMSAPKWRTCQAEAQGFVLDREEAKDNTQLCVNSFRKCCVHSVIRKAREEAVDEAVDEAVEVEEE